MAVILGSLGIIASSGRGGEEDKRAELMRRKLEYSKNVLEGLAREDFGLIASGASGLKAVSEAAEWKASTIPNFEEYLAYTTDFQRLCDDLGKNARSKNLDGATLSYVQLTLNCVHCHKYVRRVTR